MNCGEMRFLRAPRVRLLRGLKLVVPGEWSFYGDQGEKREGGPRSGDGYHSGGVRRN